LRHEIQSEINGYGQRGFKPDRARVAELVEAIQMLNTAIEEVEAVVNLRGR
jgi:hypothetical protein